MKHTENDAASFYCSGDMLPSITRLCDMIKRVPACLEPFRGDSEKMRQIFSEGGFQLYPTVKKTTLFFDPDTDCFFKILHPMNLKNRLTFLLTDKAKAIYGLTERLISEGITIQKVKAYGRFRSGSRPFFAVKRAEGESLYDIMIRGGRVLPLNVLSNVLEVLAGLHSTGFWLGDAHLSHIFIKGSEVSGIIDADSIRKNRPFRLKRLARDIAGLNHPGLPLTDDDKYTLIRHYLKNSAVKNEKEFLQMIKYYTEKRWKD